MSPKEVLRGVVRFLFTETSELALRLSGVPAAFLTSGDGPTTQRETALYPERVEENTKLSRDERLWLSEMDLEDF